MALRRVSKKQRASIPEKLSDLFEAAIADFRGLIKSGGAIGDMGEWVRYGSTWRGDTCHVCLAGAMMVARLADKFFLLWNSEEGGVRNPPATRVKV